VRPGKRNKKLADDARPLRAWKQFHRDQLAEALVGLHRDVMGRLMEQLKARRSARELVAFIESIDWTQIDTNTRMVAVHEINTAITKLREHADPLTPIFDPLPGQPENAFRIIRKIITDSAKAGDPGAGRIPGK